MKLAIFDLDGTILDTNEVDGDCFMRAARELGVDYSDLDWSQFEHVTDIGIANQLGIPHIKDRFLELLAAEERARFQPFPGALELLDALPRYGWKPVIATGAWEASARIKLGDRLNGIPLSACDAGISREEILRHAIGARTYERIVSIGDGSWDEKTARNLHIPFVWALNDYRDVEKVVRLLESAE